MSSIDDIELKAKKRAQPYINLTNGKYTHKELFEQSNLDAFKKLNLKSIYYRTEQLKLDQEFAEILNKLTAGGMREVLVFCERESSNLTSEQFNAFISEYGIRINLQVAPTSEETFAQIKEDQIGKKDTLGFDKIVDYKILYKDGAAIGLLNSPSSEEIIRNNHSLHLQEIAKAHKFGVKDPVYITKSNQNEPEVRAIKLNKNSKDVPLESQVQLEVSQEIDVEVTVNQEVEQEKELDIDQEQLANKMDVNQANVYLNTLYNTAFHEYDLPFNRCSMQSHYAGDLHSVFSSHHSIKYITKEAVSKIAPHIHLFSRGIDVLNLPIGLALKDGIIFASEERLSKMPINDATVRLDYITSEVSDPINFSWLHYATKNSISLNDLYKLEGCPKIEGSEEHPFIVSEDTRLDIPRNFKNAKYTYDNILGRTIQYPYDHESEKTIFCSAPVNEEFFPKVHFDPLNAVDKARINEIWQELVIRNLNDETNRIIRTFPINDGGFLLSEKAAIFFDRLFNEILPISSDSSKLAFFKYIISFLPQFGQQSLEDVFEGLEFGYQKFQNLLVAQDVNSAEEQSILLSKFKDLLKMQLQVYGHFKLTISKVFGILEINARAGGSLEEQLDHLESGLGADLASLPGILKDAAELDVNIVHSRVFQSDFGNELNSLYKHLSKIPPHQRASIDSYSSSISRVDGGNHALSCIPFKHHHTAEYEIHTLFKDQLMIYDVTNEENFLIRSKEKYFWLNEEALALLPENERSETLETINASKQHTLIKFTQNSLKLDWALGKKHIYLECPDCEVVVTKLLEVLSSKNRAFGTLQNEDMEILHPLIPNFEEFESETEELYIAEMFADNNTNKVRDGIGRKESFIIIEGNTVRLFLEGTEQEETPNDISEQLREWYVNGSNAPNLWIPNKITEIQQIQDKVKTFLLYKAGGNKAKLEELIEQTPKEYITAHRCPEIALTMQDHNFVNNFTVSQTHQNTLLFQLNALSSTGRHYERQYPDQEFASYLSLFNQLFEKVKITEPVHVRDVEPAIYEDYNSKLLSFQPKPKSINIPGEVTYKERIHKEIIQKFLKTYQDNPEFKFGEVVALGLIEVFHPGKSQASIESAKTLLQYHGDLYQLLRILLANDISQNLDTNAANVARNLEFLTKDDIHSIITKNGSESANLVFFAACFGNKADVSLEDIQTFLTKLEALPKELKDKILDAFANSALPFKDGKIHYENNFPKLNLEMLDDHESLADFGSNITTVSYEHLTKYNDVSKAVLQNVKPDLSALESKFNLKFTPALKNMTFSQLKQALLADEKFIVKNTNAALPDILEFAFASEMFATLVERTSGWESVHIKTMELVFDKTHSFSKQFIALELIKNNLDALLQKCASTHEQERVLDILLSNTTISKDTLSELLVYLKGIDLTVLKLTLEDLFSITPKNLYTDNLSLFKITTNFLLTVSSITPEQLYKKVSDLASLPNSEKFSAKILAYCQKHNDFSLLEFVTNLNTKARNLPETIKWLTSLTAENIKQLLDNQHLDLKSLLSLKEISKITLISKIASKLDEKLSADEYKKLITFIKEHSLDEAQLVHSYLLAQPIKGLTEQNKIDMVFANLENLSALQTMYSKYSLNRFDFDPARLKAKIQEITIKSLDGASLATDKQIKLYETFTTIMQHASTYKDLNYNQLHNKAIELKHIRTLSKENSAEEQQNQALEFIALAAEVMYRETGFFPRDTQMLSILNTILHENHLIAEIATGQGKSIITALHATYLWFTGQTVDVVTSSRDLAKRDLESFATFYDALGIAHAEDIIKPQSDLSDYKKGGVNFAIASDLALFRSDREFYSHKNDVAFNADVSIICDEIDATLTSDVNYKLAMQLLNTNEIETKALFNYLLDFAATPVFTNTQISRQDDIENLMIFLKHQFEKYDSSLHFPLTLLQQHNLLKHEDDAKAQMLYHLNKALMKCIKDANKLFDKLLNSVVLAHRLEKGVDFVVLEHNDNRLKAIPIIKDQPSYDTMFGDGVQAFVHLLLERENPNWAGKFYIQAPTSTIFNVSPKNFFDYYHLTGGRIIGLTGTAGSKIELEEFLNINKIVACYIPKYEEDKKQIIEGLVANANEQTEAVLKLVIENEDRPIVIFCESTKHAESIYEAVVKIHSNTQLFAASENDSGSITKVVRESGNKGTVTVTTPMLGRGTDFHTKYPEGYLGINLCTEITPSGLLQIYGRVARNGHVGKMVSFFNKEQSGDDVEQYMLSIAEQEMHARTRTQPLTDILKYFSNINHDQPLNAVLTNEFVTKTWNKIIAASDKSEAPKSMGELRADLVEVVKVKYPDTCKDLDSYLQLIDSTTRPAPKAYFALNSIQPDSKYNLLDQTVVEEKIKKDGIEKASNSIGISYQMFTVPKSVELESDYQLFYQLVVQIQYGVMLSHSLSLAGQYKATSIFTNLHFSTQSDQKATPTEVLFSLDEDGKIRVTGNYTKTKTLSLKSSRNEEGITKSLAEKIIAYYESSLPIELTLYEENVFYNNFDTFSKTFGGAGSLPGLMLPELKLSFNNYIAQAAFSSELEKISELVNNFMAIEELDLSRLEYGKFQAIEIRTEFDDQSGHVESILTDGKVLFWINRGGGANIGAGIGEGTGIKIFKIIKDFEQVKSILNNLRVYKSQTETRKDIFSLLREDGDESFPAYAMVPMKPQKVGNCGWTQIKGMLYAFGIIGRLGTQGLDELPDVSSQWWQKIIKDARDVYKDFTTFDRIMRAEDVLYMLDSTFHTIFLGGERKTQIDAIRPFVKEPIILKVLEMVLDKLEHTEVRYVNTVYEGQYRAIVSKLQLEVAFASEYGKVLQQELGSSEAKIFLANYQKSQLGSFKDLEKIFEAISSSNLKTDEQVTSLFKLVTSLITHNAMDLDNMDEIITTLRDSDRKCIATDSYDEYCVLEQFSASLQLCMDGGLYTVEV